MIRSPLVVLLTSIFILPACATQTQVAALAVEPSQTPEYSHRDGQLDFDLSSGLYACDHGLSVGVEREVTDRVSHRVHIAWNGARYQLERDHSYSGLPRFEDASSGLVWIDLPWKGVLLDGKTQKPLANECRFT